MTKQSRFERAQREARSARTLEIEAEWAKNTPPDVAAAFAQAARAAHERPRREPPPDMAPGTLPRPPRPGREPKPAKEEQRPRRY
jgi:hypothetical protein